MTVLTKTVSEHSLHSHICEVQPQVFCPEYKDWYFIYKARYFTIFYFITIFLLYILPWQACLLNVLGVLHNALRVLLNVSGALHNVPDVLQNVTGVLHNVWDVLHNALGVLCNILCVLHNVPGVLRNVPGLLCNVSDTCVRCIAQCPRSIVCCATHLGYCPTHQSNCTTHIGHWFITLLFRKGSERAVVKSRITDSQFIRLFFRPSVCPFVCVLTGIELLI